MGADEPTSEPVTQRQFDELREQVAVNRADIDTLLDRADASVRRADASEAREETSRRRADESEALADKDRLRIDDLEAHVDIDREMMLELHEAGLLKKEQVTQLQEALRTSRMIGAAIGIIMADRVVTQDDAFLMLKQASQHTNRKLREIAEALVLTGDIAVLPTD